MGRWVWRWTRRSRLRVFLCFLLLLGITPVIYWHLFREKPSAQCSLSKGNPKFPASLRDAIARVANLQSNVESIPWTKHQTLVVQACPNCGLGNIFDSIITGFVLSLLTDRLFLVRWNRLDDLLCPPFFWSAEAAEYHGAISLEGPHVFHLAINHLAVKNASSLVDLVRCSDLRRTFENHQVLVFQSDQYLVPLLWDNPHHRKRLLELFPGAQIASALAPFLVRAVDAIEERVAMAQASRGRNATKIALQVRTQHGDHSPDLDHFFWRCLLELNRPGVDVSAASFFISTLHHRSVEYFSSKFPGHVLALPHQIEHQRYTVGHLHDAMVDLLLLSRSHILVTSSMSTFGYIAHALSPHPAWSVRLDIGPGETEYW